MPINRWNHTLDLKDTWRNHDAAFEWRRDEIVRRLRAAPFYADGGRVLRGLVDDLAKTASIADFDREMAYVYTWADMHRVWIET